jgi:hypothetical protein
MPKFEPVKSVLLVPLSVVTEELVARQPGFVCAAETSGSAMLAMAAAARAVAIRFLMSPPLTVRKRSGTSAISPASG